VTNVSVKGEFLSEVPWNILDRIGKKLPDILHGGADVSGDDLHSQALLTAFLQSDLDDVSVNLTPLIGMLFNKKLYAFDTGQSNPNFIELKDWVVSTIGNHLKAKGQLNDFIDYLATRKNEVSACQKGAVTLFHREKDSETVANSQDIQDFIKEYEKIMHIKN
jgi:hypothetical protein